MESATLNADDARALRREIDRLKSDLERLRGDFSGLASDAVATAKAGVTEVKHRVEERAHSAANKGRETAEAVVEQVAAHPYVSLAAAFGVGMVLGIGLSRRD
jgi:ElaB/YqjD/DUF883 family membrane-anchored ribosome-binding protein